MAVPPGKTGVDVPHPPEKFLLGQTPSSVLMDEILPIGPHDKTHLYRPVPLHICPGAYVHAHFTREKFVSVWQDHTNGLIRRPVFSTNYFTQHATGCTFQESSPRDFPSVSPCCSLVQTASNSRTPQFECILTHNTMLRLSISDETTVHLYHEAPFLQISMQTCSQRAMLLHPNRMDALGGKVRLHGEEGTPLSRISHPSTACRFPIMNRATRTGVNARIR